MVARQILAHLDFLDASITELTEQIGARFADDEWTERHDHLVTAPGVGDRVAEIFLAETGGDMAQFGTAHQLASWIGLAPATRESAGKRQPAGSMNGNKHLRTALVEAATSAARTDTFLGARYRRIAARRGPKIAAVAVAHSLAVALFFMISQGQDFADLGSDHYQRPDQVEHALTRHRQQLELRGYTVIAPSA